MSYLVVVLLSLLWLGFFLPGLLQARRTSSPLNSATTFQESLTRISNGRAVTPADAAQAARRRPRSRREIARQRDVLMVLAATFGCTVALGFAFGGPVRWLVVPAAVAFFGYVIVLRVQAAERRLARQSAAAARRAALQLAEDGVVPSVGRRWTAPAQSEHREMERIAG